MQPVAGDEQGFTLIEVLMALTIFALSAAVAYGALGMAGNGFRQLSEVRDTLEKSGWIGRQLRSDVAYLALPQGLLQAKAVPVSAQKYPLVISNDNRGNSEFDQLWLLVREPGQAGISQVHYYIDEGQGHLIRESRLLWARDGTKSIRWDMGEALSCSVEVMGKDGRWLQAWQTQGPFIWPRGLRIRVRYNKGGTDDREWYLPIQFGVDL